MPESALAHLYNQPAPRLPRRLFSELQMANSLSSIASNPTNERTGRRAAAAAFPRCPTLFSPETGAGSERAAQAHDEERTKLCAYAPSRSLTEMSTYFSVRQL